MNFMKKLGLGMFLLIILAIIVYSFYKINIEQKYETATVYEHTKFLSVEATGLIIRDEVPINFINDSSSAIEYVQAEGEHVQMNNALFRVYSSEEYAKAYNKINELQNEIDTLIKLTQCSEISYNFSENLAKSAFGHVLNLVQNIEKGVLNKSKEIKRNFLILMNKKYLATGKKEDFTYKLRTLESKLKFYTDKVYGNVNTILAKETGCFIGTTDGYEYLKTKDLFLDNTDNGDEPDLEKFYNKISSLIKNVPKIETFAFGKIITNYNWYILVSINLRDASNIIKNRSNVVLNFDIKDSQEIPATIVKSIELKDKNKKMIILKCNYMNDHIAKLRLSKVNICVNKISGLMCPFSAVRFLKNKNGVYEKGVFVHEGDLIRFKKIKTIYEDSDMIISEVMPNTVKYLERLDEVVVKSVNLFKEKVA